MLIFQIKHTNHWWEFISIFQENIREVRGLTQRLEQLDELIQSAKKTVQEQKELSTAFQQNQSRASNLGDASILPDLYVFKDSWICL